MVADEEHDEIGQLIKQGCEAPPPDAEFSRSLAAQAKQELTRALQAQPKADMPHARRGLPTAQRLRRAAVAMAGIAVLLFVGVWLWTGAESRAWAQVVDAVRARPWLHGVAEGIKEDESTAGKIEIWISMINAVGAMRHGSMAIFDDGTSGVRQEYDPERKEIIRTSTPPGTDKLICSMQAIFADLFRGREKVGQDIGGRPIVKQERRRVSDQGREWVDYSLSLGSGGTPRIVFRVDPKTLLPQSMEYFDATSPEAGAKPQVRFILDYPNDGPSDIYALGVPRSAKIVNRVPPPDLARVVEGVRNSRQRFDSYYAIVAETMDAPAIGRSDKWWQAPTLHQVWSKDDCWRVEQGRRFRDMHAPPFDAPAEPPADVTDKMAWWKNHLKDFDFQPSGVCDGKAIYAPKRAPPGTMETQQSTVWETWQTISPGTGRALAASFGPAGDFMPEHYAYSVAIGEPNRDTNVQLDPNPSEGPAGALLLKYRVHSTNLNVIPSCRYWVDPARSYVTLRYELGEAVDAKAGPDAKWPDTYVLEELRQAPSEIWYATVVRRLWSGKVTSPDRRGSTVYWFFVDFKADTPDTLFKPGPVAVEKTTTAPVSSLGASNLRNIAVAMNRYQDSRGNFPAAYTVDKQGRPLLSWRVQLLPLLGQEELYKQFHLDEPWDSQHNRTLIEKMPEAYRTPASGADGPPGAKAKEPGQTNYVVPVGKETAFPGRDAVGASDIKDGCADTIMAVEVDDDHAVIWTKPEDFPFDAANPAEGLAALPKGGFWAVLCDGSVRWIPKEFDPKYLRAAFTRAGGEAIEW
jgi:hypothetical protein